MVSIAVSVIPEGLPALITVTLAIGVQRMAKHNAIIRRLPAVETLRSVSRICSDKTGTLTLMEMMVVSVSNCESAYRITGKGYAPGGEMVKNGKPRGWRGFGSQAMGRVSMLCNDAEIWQEEGSSEVEGDPTEGALYPFANKIGLEREVEQAEFPRMDAIPFESEHSFMAALTGAARGGRFILVKGTPEVILEHATGRQTKEGARRRSTRAFHETARQLAAQGERVLALVALKTLGSKAGSLSPADLPGTWCCWD